MQDTKYIFVTGGVLSGLGKGLVSASTGKLLQNKSRKVVPVKCDGYLNVDPGTMNPEEHGEVYVLEDGTEVDMDFGHYERFLDVTPKGSWNLTSGKVFKKVIDKEREGEYLGQTVQMVPHVTDEIKEWWSRIASKNDADILLIEIGGTVGDMENQLFLEAARQVKNELPNEDTIFIHTTLVPYLNTVGEQKTKPTQHSVKSLQELGLSPDVIVGRSESWMEDKVKDKIALFCDVNKDAVISDPDLNSVYELPLVFKDQDLDKLVKEKLDLSEGSTDLTVWKQRVKNIQSDPVAKVAIVGKYTGIDDSYASVEEALKHAAAANNGSVEIEYLSSENMDASQLEDFDGLIVPGGFGSRGIPGKLNALEFARENDLPTLGICLGMQLMVIEYFRNELGIEATSEEFELGGEPVISSLPDQEDVENMGGTMRLGSFENEVQKPIKDIYGSKTVSERHRHRYEFDPEYYDKLEGENLQVVGSIKGGRLAEFVAATNHPFYVGTQAHPEFNSTLESPNPLFEKLISESS